MSDFTGEIPKEINSAELEFSDAFYLEQKLIADGAPEIEIFIARQDRMAKEIVCMEQSGLTEIIPLPVIEHTPPAFDVSIPVAKKVSTTPVELPEEKVQPSTSNNGLNEVDPITGSRVIHKSYRPAAEAAVRISKVVEKADYHDMHGLPIKGLTSELMHDYETIIADIMQGKKGIDSLPIPYSAHERAKAKQALASIAGDTDDSIKNDEWTEKFFELQVSLIG